MKQSSRRDFLSIGAKLFLGGLAVTGLYMAVHIFPRPPKKVLVKGEELKNKNLYVAKDFFLVKQQDSWLALWRRCPHLGCQVNYDPRQEIFICPCHQSRFTKSGQYIAGPAKKDLEVLAVSQKQGGLIVELPG
ncbi:Rieske (2Fe-2S) iron-sulfur domain protein [Thermodesulfatator indicus DSM 15286]|uniref:Rieske (2Fe-2S) iron-sulfur domain protein n=1 Tax=Thermodesulfatator indicus (strain DSM 15286 / JCM 11887 / CIR29812) TaxID=667014 RepID=F8ABU1_THEID|nr:ubiquinol-cytochrome c reductase iron-sulfur subunit [Thermodesulfatator indicus]AEH44548.1 Rieske (2Fe-2S) iron-sulfur domain protein [Thermodesulfatator indicus DSM 15286]